MFRVWGFAGLGFRVRIIRIRIIMSGFQCLYRAIEGLEGLYRGVPRQHHGTLGILDLGI